METEPITLHVQCEYCQGAVTLKETPWPCVASHDGSPVAPDNPLLKAAFWYCPHCHQKNHGGFPGRTALTKKGHGPDGKFGMSGPVDWIPKEWLERKKL